MTQHNSTLRRNIFIIKSERAHATTQWNRMKMKWNIHGENVGTTSFDWCEFQMTSNNNIPPDRLNAFACQWFRYCFGVVIAFGSYSALIHSLESVSIVFILRPMPPSSTAPYITEIRIYCMNVIYFVYARAKWCVHTVVFNCTQLMSAPYTCSSHVQRHQSL